MASNDGVSLSEVTNDALRAFADPLLVDDAASCYRRCFSMMGVKVGGLICMVQTSSRFIAEV
jgi:hypothetical protein